MNFKVGEKGIEVFEFSIKEIEDKIRSGEVYDAMSICAFYLAVNHFNQY